MLYHEDSGLRVGGDMVCAEWVECSLPRLLYGCNGYLLRPMDVPGALNRVRRMVESVVPGAELNELERADLALHLEVEPEDAIAALRGICHPSVRSKPREFFGTGLEWQGSHTVIRLYDKRAEQDKVPGDIMRLEFQLRAKALEKSASMWNGIDLCPQTAHEIFCKLARGFQPRRLAKPSSILQFVAMLHQNAVQIDGRPILDLFLTMKKSKRYRDRLRRRINEVEVPEMVMHWDYLLYEHAMPKLLDVPPLEKEERATA